MALHFECPACRAELQSDDALLEATVRCAKCSALLYLATPEKPIPRFCDMEVGPEPEIVHARFVDATPPLASESPALPGTTIAFGDSRGGIGASNTESAP